MTSYALTYLKHVDDPSHVPCAEPKHGFDSIRSQLKSLTTTNALNPGPGLPQGDLLKFEASASRLQGRNDLGDVVGDEAEADITMILLDN